MRCAVVYPGQPGKATTFAYDGLSRRTAITSTPAGGGTPVTTSYIWCGSSLCQARDASDATTREYYAEGEFVPGTPAQSYYYGVDQIGSVRRVFSAGGATAYSYDPYGTALQATAPVTDFGYAGMFHNADSGLYLTQYRAYDPTVGRWLSRDPLGESSDPAANLYRYADGNPVALTDPSGRFGIAGAVLGAAFGGLSDVAAQLASNGGSLACVNWGQVALSAGIGAATGATLGLVAPELIAEEEAASIATPYAVEVQGSSAEAQTALEAVQNGAPLYRTGQLGQSMAGESQYWSLENPMAPGYAEKIGMPNVKPDFVLRGTLNQGASAVTNEAPGLGSNAGGGIQVVTSPGGVGSLQFTMPPP